MEALDEFRETIERYRFSKMPDTTVINVTWPAFERFDEALRELNRRYPGFPSAQTVDKDLVRFRLARLLLRSSFAAPDDSDVGLSAEAELPRAEGDLGALQGAVRLAAAALACETHPAVDALRKSFESTSRFRWPTPGVCRVVVTGPGKAASERALVGIGAAQGVAWEVRSLSESKRAGHCSVTLLAGSPELLLDWRTAPEERAALVAWLFNAPMSPYVVAMLWAGSVHFDSNRYEAGPVSSVLDALVVDIGGIELPRSMAFDDVDLPPASSRPTQPKAVDETTVESIDFMLPEQKWISFGIEDGPRPRRVDDESEFEIEIESVRLTNRVRVGDVLVVLEATADRAYRRKLCGEWIRGNTTSFDVTAALTQIDVYKGEVRRLRHRPDLVRELIAKGLEYSYVQSQIARASDPDTIAPQWFEHFKLIASVVGVNVNGDDWEKVLALRAGYMHAGKVISSRLRDAVRDDTSWLGLVGQQQIARITVENLGTVTLAPVLRVIAERAQRPESQLGVIGA